MHRASLLDLRRQKAVAAGVAAVVAAALFQALPPASAVHDTGAFELDGNAVATTSDDWNEVCYQKAVSGGATASAAAALCGATNGTSGASAVGWAEEPALNSTIFTGGGSKDPEDISKWLWKDESGGLPDKDNLLHAFAARYTIGGDEVLFFGSDRYDNNGDAQTGFWFLQDSVALGGATGPAFGFTGNHQNGDVLVVSHFSNGGSTATISVYEWDSSCLKGATKPGIGDCGDKNLRLDATSEAANCGSASSGDSACGIVNTGDGTVAPWSFLDKGGNTTYRAGEFFEGGINLTDLGLGDRCFASFVSETRSSTSTTATLKDFVLGGFGSCGSAVTTQARNGADTADLSSTSIGSGIVSTRDRATVAVTGKATWGGSVQFSLRGPVGQASSSTANVGSPVAVSNTTSFPITSAAATVTSVGQYCWSATFTSSTQGVPNATDDGTNECFTVTAVTPSLATTAGPDVVLGNAVTDTASLSGTATQPGSPIINGAAGPAAGGTIQFTLLKSDCTTLATGTGTNPQTVTVSGNGSYGPVSFTPDAVGTYHWKAVYTPATGDPNNLGSTHNGDCTDSDETVVVNTVPTSLTSAQRYLPNDQVTVTAQGGVGGNLAGSVRFRAYESADCSGTPIVDQTVNVSGASPQTVSSTNTAVYSTSSVISWKVNFTSTNVAQRSIADSCHESMTVAIANGGTVNSP